MRAASPDGPWRRLSWLVAAVACLQVAHAAVSAATPAAPGLGRSDSAATCPTMAATCGGTDSVAVRVDGVNSLSLVSNVAMLSPTPRAYHSGIKANRPVSNMTFLAVFGGCADMSNGDNALQDTWILDFVSRTWFDVSFVGMVPKPRFAHDASATSDLSSMIIFGGLVPDGPLNNTCRDGASAAIDGTFTDDTWLLLPSNASGTRRWDYIFTATKPSGRAGHSMATGSNGVILFGGMTSNDSLELTTAEAGPGVLTGRRRMRSLEASDLLALNDTWRFNGSLWSEVLPDGGPVPPSRHSHTAVNMDLPADPNQPTVQPWLESIVIFGGTSSLTIPIEDSAQFYNDIWAFDVATSTWREVTPASTNLPPARHSHAAVVTANGTLIVYAGANAQGDHLRDIWEYDPHTNSWRELTPWFESSNPNLQQNVRSTMDNFDYRDKWGHVGLTISNEIYPADTFVMFGGLNSQLYFASVTNDVYEFVRGLAPKPNELVLWRSLAVGSGPFYRVQHTLVKHGSVLNEANNEVNASQSGCKCLFTQPFVIAGVQYFGCAKPLGWDDYICPVDPQSCPEAHCLDSSLSSMLSSALTFDFCGEDTLLLFGGRYDGDADHLGVTDPPGKVWKLQPDRSTWQVDEMELSEQVPPPMSLHTMVRVGGYQHRRRAPAPWAGDGKAMQEGYLVFGGELESAPYSMQLPGLHYYEPPRVGAVSSWRVVNASLDASMRNARLKRSEHGAAVHAYMTPNGIEEDMYVFGGYFLRGWADRPPVSGDSLFLRYNVANNTWYSMPVVAGPEPRFAASLVYVALPEPMLVLFGGEAGGTRLGSRLLNDTWIYNLTSHTWLQLQPPPGLFVADATAWPGAREGHAASAFGNKVFIQGGKRYVTDPQGQPAIYTDSMCAQVNSGCAFCDLWILDLSQVSSDAPYAVWTALPTDDSCQADNSPMLRHHAAATYHGRMYLFGGYEGTLGFASAALYQTPMGCTAGSRGADFFVSSCDPCQAGSYAPDQGYLCCLPCVQGTTTAGAGAVAPGNCSVCDPKICIHGSCTVSSLGEAQCTCDWLYWQVDHCQRPLSLAIPILCTAAILFLYMIFNIVRRYRTSRNIKQMQLMISQREVEELSRGWEIQAEEVKLIERIDTRSPGAYGEVWLAEWQGMKVAFKKLNRALLELDEAGYTAEFDREVRFMRATRNTNVVLFFGAGRLPDGTPFLVTEYMACGSLQEVLHDPDKAIDLSLKIRFALDAAKGMRYLHFCQPPRIHRDLKTGNLLVSDRWVVKVADFGTSRLLENRTTDLSKATTSSWWAQNTAVSSPLQRSYTDSFQISSKNDSVLGGSTAAQRRYTTDNAGSGLNLRSTAAANASGQRSNKDSNSGGLLWSGGGLKALFSSRDAEPSAGGGAGAVAINGSQDDPEEGQPLLGFDGVEEKLAGNRNVSQSTPKTVTLAPGAGVGSSRTDALGARTPLITRYEEGSGTSEKQQQLEQQLERGRSGVGQRYGALDRLTEVDSMGGSGYLPVLSPTADGRSGAIVQGAAGYTQLEREAGLQMTRHVGTPLYMAPEIMADHPHTRASDVYSFGVVLWEIYTRQVPFSELASSSIFKLRREVQAGLRPDIPPDCPPQLAQLIRECWSASPVERPNFEVIVTRLTAMADLSSLLGDRLTPQKAEPAASPAKVQPLLSVVSSGLVRSRHKRSSSAGVAAIDIPGRREGTASLAGADAGASEEEPLASSLDTRGLVERRVTGSMATSADARSMARSLGQGLIR